MTVAAIGFGSNSGDRTAHLAAALSRVAELGRVRAVSPVYETAPVGGPPQPNYLNMVVLVETRLGPRALLEALLDIERAAGRQRREKWGPRPLDLDLLLYGEESIDEPGLTVPHPRLTERRFTLEPLLEIDPGAALPDGTPLSSFLGAVADQEVLGVAPPLPAGGRRWARRPRRR